ncbi:ATP-dependent DNA helicase RecG [Cyanobium sp. CH-040]|uniref:ATP-dependent DNA helicase RecG n=1 Tax=Cyanobium sp. CH-040 TaxID=2823708 RepID=UPI0020CC05AA|nr:ATP-dependent DNA helicase RecG [Cyanobium sp. CH-040]MCP9926914.1 ATP-dependent DNA helicase RecG [Cyanobium sp. CH-040]
MAPGQPQVPTAVDPAAAESWFRTLHQALQLESDRGFGDLTGRRERFSVFLARSLRQPPEGLRPAATELELAEQFTRYSDLTQSQRQHLVTRCRQCLQAWRQRSRPADPPGPPRLRLVEPAPAPAALARLTADTPLAEIPGVGPRTATRMAQLGLFVARDLLHYYPRDYLDYANLVRIHALEPGTTATIVAAVRSCRTFVSPRNPQLAILELQLADPTGRIRVSRFYAGKRFTSPAWLKLQQRQFPSGATVAVSGLVKDGPYGPQFQDPLMEVLSSPQAPVRSTQIGRLIPVYGLTEGLGADRLRQAIAAVLPLLPGCPDPLPEPVRQAEGLIERASALQQIHAPANRDQLQASRRRLVFDEFLLMQLGLLQRRRQLTARPAPPLAPGAAPHAGSPAGGAGVVQRFLELLPFGFTAAQERVLAEIRADLAREQPMARLLQGDVGSGKTVVAVAALLTAVEAGCQGALMAPTEVLAEQHHARLAAWLPRLHVNCGLLTGATPARRRRQLLDDLANGQLQLLVGTHALLEDPVQFARLGLVVVDEQHRFGVRQRDRLLHKGLQPHLLTMTATPIPRTLALSLHGDLEVSQIDELPPGRTPVRTRLLKASQRQEAYDLIRAEVARGQRAYVVLPLVEESEKSDLRSAVEVHRQLAGEVFPDLRVGLLHGRMASADKQTAITAFARGDTQLLVSTTVVEVGVDVPEASVMVIEHAERFGLAQLHQLRGRVGRGAAASHCLLVHDGRNPQARQRLEVLVRSSDGFEIAEMDLRLRGPGQVLGTRQSGLPDLALASLADDGEVLERARELARRILERDPELSQLPHLAALLARQRRALSQPAPLN